MQTGSLILGWVILLAACAESAEPVGDPPAAEGDVPTSASPLFAYLSAGTYKDYVHESALHPSAGPHPVNVLVYLNCVLDASLKAGSARHPAASAAVKELYSSSGTLTGWAVMVKVRDDRQDGSAWYWYEVTSRDPSRASRPDYEGVGLALCSGCHSSGRDFIRIAYPLR